ncbi:MAG: pilus assembly protein PilM [Planctomycetota bacterium]
MLFQAHPMAFGKTKSRLSPIGIDFGADSLKLLQIVPGDPPELVALGSATLPEDARTDLNARLAFLNEALPSLLRRHGFKQKRVMLSIPAFQTMVNNLLISRGDAKEIDGQVDLALRTRLNLEPSRMVIRNYPGIEVFRDSIPKQEVITFAAHRDVVMQYIDLANRLKLEVAGMHCEAPCVLRAFSHLNPSEASDTQRTIAFIDLGAATTKIIVSRGEKMLLAKTIHAGGDQWTRRLASEQDMDFAEARLARVAEASGDSSAVAVAPAPASDTSEHACETTECLIDELGLTFRHYHARYPEQPIEKIVFIGGEAHRIQTCQQLARSVHVAAQLGDPFARLSRLNATSPTGIDLAQPQPGWAVALGLCLSEANL